MSAVAPLWMRGAALAVNRVLALDPDADTVLGELGSCAIGVQVEGLGLRFVLNLADARVSLLPWPADAPVDVEVSGPPFSLIGLLRGQDDVEQLGSGVVRVRGDAGRLQALRRALGRLDVDWEELLAGQLGDVVAHQAGNLARDAQRWWRRAAGDLREDLRDYLTEESAHLPRAVSVQSFLVEVDRLRDDVERLEQRIARLTRRMDAGPARQ